MNTDPDHRRYVPVVIVGAGPTGLAAATFLGQYGIETLVFERWPGIYPQPRAVHLDDEVYRILARLGVAEQFAAISRPSHGLRLLDRRMRVLAEFRRDATEGLHGFPAANMFDQPDLEAVLRANLKQHESVTLHGGIEVTEIEHDESGATVSYADCSTGQGGMVRAQYVLGCDGANSLARTSIGARMKDLGFAQRWLVVDIATDEELGQWEGVHQVCDVKRAATFMRIGATRYRWEFRLAPEESVELYERPERVFALTAPWTGKIPQERLDLVRVAEYTFRAQVADRWRDRRIFLLGDAAHLTPPFIGQGMGAGLRDAANLAWKLAGVLNGTLTKSALTSYEDERKPHATAMIRLAKLIGTVMTRGGRAGDLLRQTLAPRLTRLPGANRVALSSQTPPLRRSALIVRPRMQRTLAGTLCPNARIDDNHRFDDLAAGRFALVTMHEPAPRERQEVARRGGIVVTAAPDSDLYRWLRAARVRSALVRPDGTVLR